MHVLLFILTLIVGFVGALIAYPVIAFSLYEAVYFFYPQNRWWGSSVPGISYSFFTVILMFLLVVTKTKSDDRNMWSCPQTKWIWLLFLNWAAINHIAILPDLHWDATVNYFKMLVIMTVAYYLINSKRAFDIAVWGYLYGSWYISFFAFQIGRNAGDRLEGIGTVDAPDANGIAAAIAPSIVLFLYYFWISKKKWQKIAFALGGALAANAIVLINSRGAFLAVAVSLCFFMSYMYFSKFKVKSQNMMAVMITVMGLSGVLAIADESFIERIYSIKTTEVQEDKESAGTRTLFWLATVDMVKDLPYGKGIGTFNIFGGDYVPQTVDMGGKGGSRNRAVHSTWFEALSDTGYLGLLGLIALIISAFVATNQCKRKLIEQGNVEEYYKVIAIQSALLGFIVAMTFINRLRAEVLYWLLIYTCAAYNLYIVKNLGEDKQQESDSLLGKAKEGQDKLPNK